MLEMVKMYTSGISAVDITKIVYFSGFSENESRKSSAILFTLTQAVTS